MELKEEARSPGLGSRREVGIAVRRSWELRFVVLETFQITFAPILSVGKLLFYHFNKLYKFITAKYKQKIVALGNINLSF